KSLKYYKILVKTEEVYRVTVLQEYTTENEGKDKLLKLKLASSNDYIYDPFKERCNLKTIELFTKFRHTFTTDNKIVLYIGYLVSHC
ncbi:hypothetical protein L9F63_005590, partial [Diploptera punctata]